MTRSMPFTKVRSAALPRLLPRSLSFPLWDLVEITGGEPLLQTQVHDLIRALLELGKTVLIETGGALDVSAVDPRAHPDLRHQVSGQRHGRQEIAGKNIALLKTS